MTIKFKRKVWRNYLKPDSDEVHIVPENDTMDHWITDCLCKPTAEPIKRDDGSIAWLVTHNAEDGRE